MPTKILLVTIAAFAATPAGAQAAADSCSVASPTTHVYKTVTGVNPNLLSLDVYMPSSTCRNGKKAPVVVWVHGGAYTIGDKRTGGAATKAQLFNSKGWAFVSINYRLTDMSSPKPWRWPIHYEDGAAAIKWIKTNIASRGGDPTRISVVGHSAGADLVSNLATQPNYLGKYALGPSVMRCQAPLDTDGFDKVSAADPDVSLWAGALGNAPDFRRTTSATLIARRGVGTPRAIVALRGTAARIAVGNAYIAKLASLGITGNRSINARGLTHEEVSGAIGSPGDTVMTPPLVSFLTDCFK